MAIENKRLSLVLDMVDKITAPSQKLAASTKKVGTELAKTTKSLHALQAQASDISKLSKLQGEMDKTGNTFKAASAKVGHLKVQMAMVEKPTAAMRKELREAEKAVKAADKAHRAQEQAVGALSDKLRRAGVDTSHLAQAMRNNRTETARVTSEFRTQTRALDDATKAQQRYTDAKAAHDKYASAAGKAGAVGAGMVAGGAGLIAASYAAGSPFRSFDAQMSAVQATGGMSDEARARLAKLARDEAKVSAWGATDAASAQEFLAMAGFDEKAITDSLRGVMNLASATKTGLAETADISSNILSGFGLDPAEMQRVGDVLTKVTTTSNTNLTELGGAMKYVAPVAKTAGYEIESVAAAAGLMANAGIKDSQAGTALRAAVLRMASLPKAAKKAFSELGVETTDAQGNLRGLEHVLADVAKAMEGMGSGERLQKLSAMFGVEASAGLAELLDKSSGAEMMAYIEKLKGAKGATDQAAATRLKNLDGDLKNLSSAVEEVQLKYGDAMDSFYRGIVQTSTSVIQSIDGWMERNPKMVKAIGLVATAIGVVMAAMGSLLMVLAPILLMIGKYKLAVWALTVVKQAWIASAIGARVATVALNAQMLIARAGVAAMVMWGARYAAITKAVTVAQWAVNAAMTANPIGIVIVAVAALVAAGIALYQNWDKVSAFFGEMWEGIKATFSGGVDYVMNLLNMNPLAALDKVGGDIIGFFSGMWDTVTRMCDDFFGGLFEKFDKLMNFFKNPFGGDAKLDAQVKGAPARGDVTGDDFIPTGDERPIPKAVSGGAVKPPRPAGGTKQEINLTLHVEAGVDPGQFEKIATDATKRVIDEANRKREREERARMRD